MIPLAEPIEPNPHRPRAFGGKGAEGMKKGIPISQSRRGSRPNPREIALHPARKKRTARRQDATQGLSLSHDFPRGIRLNPTPITIPQSRLSQCHSSLTRFPSTRSAFEFAFGTGSILSTGLGTSLKISWLAIDMHQSDRVRMEYLRSDHSEITLFPPTAFQESLQTIFDESPN
jgi:hypothetical protein